MKILQKALLLSMLSAGFSCGEEGEEDSNVEALEDAETTESSTSSTSSTTSTSTTSTTSDTATSSTTSTSSSSASSTSSTSTTTTVSYHAHVCYTDITNSNLMHATNRTGSWVTETVDSSAALTGYQCSLAVDASNNVHISYLDYTNKRIMYATNTTGSWVTEVIEATNSNISSIYQTSTSIAIDSSGTIHIIYGHMSSTSTEGSLRHASGSAGSFTSYDMTGSNDVYMSAGSSNPRFTVAIDSSNTLHVAYVARSTLGLAYRSGTANSYGSETDLSSVVTIPQYRLAVAVNSSNLPLILSHKSSTLIYADRTGGSWSGGTAISTTTSGRFPTVDFTSSDVKFSVYEKVASGMRSATAAASSTSWTQESDTVSGSLQGTGGVLDGADTMHICGYGYGDYFYTSKAIGSDFTSMEYIKNDTDPSNGVIYTCDIGVENAEGRSNTIP